jgi:hypothetical protein
MNKVSLIPLIGLAIAGSQLQSSTELSTRYPVITSYEVRPGILMTPKYSADGQMCQMSIERQRATRSGIMMDSFISAELVKTIVDELVPHSERGPALHGSEDVVAVITTGLLNQSVHSYEKISYNVLSGPNRESVVVIKWKNRKCEADPQALPLQRYPH